MDVHVLYLCQHIFSMVSFFILFHVWKVVLLSLRASAKELFLLVVFVSVGMITFSTLIYFTEFTEPHIFQDIPTCFWWALVTMTTVGYGDMYPMSLLGRMIGALCAISGIIIFALPIPIIANNFSKYYNFAQARVRQKAEVTQN